MERAIKHQMEFGKAERLSQFDYLTFFTPALLYMYGKLTDQPLLDFTNFYQKPFHFYHHKFYRPIFKGFMTSDGNDDWDHVLWAMETEAFKVFENYMLSVVTVDWEHKHVLKVASTDATIADPLSMDLTTIIPSQLPWLPIVVFGVDGSNQAVTVQNRMGMKSILPLPIAIHPAQSRMKLFAKALMAGENPEALLALPADTPSAALPTLNIKDAAEVSPERQAELVNEINAYKRRQL